MRLVSDWVSIVQWLSLTRSPQYQLTPQQLTEENQLTIKASLPSANWPGLTFSNFYFFQVFYFNLFTVQYLFGCFIKIVSCHRKEFAWLGVLSLLENPVIWICEWLKTWASAQTQINDQAGFHQPHTPGEKPLEYSYRLILTGEAKFYESYWL